MGTYREHGNPPILGDFVPPIWWSCHGMSDLVPDHDHADHVVGLHIANMFIFSYLCIIYILYAHRNIMHMVYACIACCIHVCICTYHGYVLPTGQISCMGSWHLDHRDQDPDLVLGHENHGFHGPQGSKTTKIMCFAIMQKHVFLAYHGYIGCQYPAWG